MINSIDESGSKYKSHNFIFNSEFKIKKCSNCNKTIYRIDSILTTIKDEKTYFEETTSIIRYICNAMLLPSKYKKEETYYVPFDISVSCNENIIKNII